MQRESFQQEAAIVPHLLPGCGVVPAKHGVITYGYKQLTVGTCGNSRYAAEIDWQRGCFRWKCDLFWLVLTTSSFPNIPNLAGTIHRPDKEILVVGGKIQ